MDRKTHKYRDRQITDIQTDRYRELLGHTCKYVDRLNKQADRQVHGQTDTWTDRQGHV